MISIIAYPEGVRSPKASIYVGGSQTASVVVPSTDFILKDGELVYEYTMPADGIVIGVEFPESGEPDKKKANTITVDPKNPSVSVSALKKKAQTIQKKDAFTIKNAQGKVTYEKKSGSGKFTVDKKTGNITIKKGTKKGVYKLKVRVTAAGNEDYEEGSRTVPVTIVIK